MTTTNDLEILSELNRSYVQSAERSDVRWFETHLADDFVAINPDGSVTDRAGFLARIAARPHPGATLGSDDVRIRLFGDVAIIHARFFSTRPDGQAATGPYTDVWARRQGQWVCVSAHFAPLTVAPRDRETLEELNRNYIRSVQQSDVAWFEQHLADDFVNSNADGTLVDRRGFLAQIARPCPVANLDVEDVRVRILGDVALIHARTTYKKPDGDAGAGRYTDVWMRRQGRWLCVSAHVTRG